MPGLGRRPPDSFLDLLLAGIESHLLLDQSLAEVIGKLGLLEISQDVSPERGKEPSEKATERAGCLSAGKKAREAEVLLS